MTAESVSFKGYLTLAPEGDHQGETTEVRRFIMDKGEAVKYDQLVDKVIVIHLD